MTDPDLVERGPGECSQPVSKTRRSGVGVIVWLRLMLLVVALIAAGFFVSTVDLSDVQTRLEAVRGAGVAAPVLFVLAYAACTLAPVPRGVLSAAAGVAFGFWWGLPVAYLGSLIGAVTAFWLARRLGRAAVRSLDGPRSEALNQTLARRGLLAVVCARLAPAVPFMAFNYIAGLTDITRRSYWLGTAMGVVPGTVAYVAVGAYASAPGPVSVKVVAGALLLLGVVWVTRRAVTRYAAADLGRGGLRR